MGGGTADSGPLSALVPAGQKQQLLLPPERPDGGALGPPPGSTGRLWKA